MYNLSSRGFSSIYADIHAAKNSNAHKIKINIKKNKNKGQNKLTKKTAKVMVMLAFSASTWEAEAGGSIE